MPARWLGDHDGAQFDLIGKCHHGVGAVTHVGILAAPLGITAATTVNVLDMGSRLNIDPPSSMIAHIAATLPLTKNQADGLAEWIAEIKTLAGHCEYIALPAAHLVEDGPSGRRKYWKFSCAGFVVTAYEHGAHIKLVVNEDCLPLLDSPTVMQIWGPVLGVANERRQRMYLRTFGLTGEGPWRVLVPGYLFHALEEASEHLPYTPAPTDIAFP
jgi:hypothetical protein